MEWKVLNYNMNRQTIVPYDVFGHGGFVHYFKKAVKKYKTKDEFAEQLRKELRYYFWSKAEYELVIEITEDDRVVLWPWIGHRNPEEAVIDVTDDNDFDWRGFAEKHIARQVYKNYAKIDVFNQIDYVWDNFVNYCWSFKKG